VPVLLSVNVGMPKNVPWQGKTVYTAVWKQPVDGPAMVRRLNTDGDGRGDLNGHGGEQRAALVYQIQSIDHWECGFQPGPDPERCDYATFADFADPDGNTWVLQEIGHRPLATATSSNAPP
jgi:hypothetical protein